MNEKKTALVTGANGQDGHYMWKYLVSLGYRVYAHSWSSGNRLYKCTGDGYSIDFFSASLSPFMLDNWCAVAWFIKNYSIDEIYHFGGQSSVSRSFVDPGLTISSHVDSTLGILEALRVCKKTVAGVKFFFAASSEMYGSLANNGASIYTPFSPTSPYGAAKVAAFETVKAFRESYDLYAASAIMFNHESPRRKETFFTAKVATGAVAASRGCETKLHLGDLSARRDFGWAPEYVVAVHEMMQLERPTDAVIGTGVPVSLEDMVKTAYEEVGLDWRNHVVIDPSLFRHNDLKLSYADPRHQNPLKWRPQTVGTQVMQRLVRERSLTLDSTTQTVS